jgi:hypothetical protein
MLPLPGLYVRRVAEIDVRPLLFGHHLDLRVFFLKPLPNQRLIAFDCSMQWLLAGDTELRQQPANGIGGQRDVEFPLDQSRPHLARPQCKRKIAAAMDSSASPCRKSIASRARSTSAAGRITVWPSNRPTRRAGSARGSHTLSVQWRPKLARQPRDFHTPARCAPHVCAESPAWYDRVSAHHHFPCRQ